MAAFPSVTASIGEICVGMAATLSATLPSKLSIIDMSPLKTDLPYGTLDLLILKTLDTMGAMHGYSLARRIEQVSESLMRLSQGSVYPALIRLEQAGWIRTEWGVSETNRKVKFYALTKAGARQLRVEVENWEKATALVARFLEAKS
jgi:transcriptional regulator